MKPNNPATFCFRTLAKSPRFFLPLLILLYSISPSATSDTSGSTTSQILSKLIASRQHPLLRQTDFSRYAEEVTQLYKSNDMQMLWLGNNRPEKNITEALNVLSNANLDGLNPDNYDAVTLNNLIHQATGQTVSDEKNLASYDLALSISLLRFMHDLQNGRVDPRAFNYPQSFGVKPAINVGTQLKTFIEQQSIATIPESLSPKAKQYQQLKNALAAYRQQENETPKTVLSLPKSLHPGESHPELPALRQRLQEMGELTSEELNSRNNDSGTIYDQSSEAAIRHIQEQQGLHADGVIGKQTQTILNQTPKEKIALIELAMERLRWLPQQPDGRFITVNIPAFQLSAFNSPDDENALTMKVVVGKAKDKQTPVLLEEMKYLEFMPYWNIPKSIMDKEMMPKIQSDDSFLARQDIELVERSVDDETEEDEEAENVVDNIKHGRVRARQRPGNKNPLGRVKFIFPNKADVYLHDTPSRGAFNRDRRDLSHGCVRVSEPEKLAEFVLDQQEGWNKQSIEEAMAGPKTRHVSLKKAIPVLIFYTTTVADQNNKLRFYPDIYGYDAQLQNALNKAEKELPAGKSGMTNG